MYRLVRRQTPSNPTLAMKFPRPLIPATLVRRYKRFLADVELHDGEIITVHCPNPGAMLGLSEPGNKVWISDSQNPKRKLRHTLELMEVEAPDGKVMVGINTMHPNKLAEEVILAGKIEALAGYSSLRREVKYGENSRIDILLEDDNRPPCYVEVKNVHFVRKSGLFEFPDSKTERGAKHLGEMASMVKQGAGAVMLYVVQRSDGHQLSLAADLDPKYAAAFEQAKAIGVEALAFRCQVTIEEITAEDVIPVIN